MSELVTLTGMCPERVMAGIVTVHRFTTRFITVGLVFLTSGARFVLCRAHL